MIITVLLFACQRRLKHGMTPAAHINPMHSFHTIIFIITMAT